MYNLLHSLSSQNPKQLQNASTTHRRPYGYRYSCSIAHCRHSGKVSRDTVERAVTVLLKWKDSQSKDQAPQLLPRNEFIYLNITLKKIPPKAHTKTANPFRIALPHPLHDQVSECCLIIDDRSNSNLTLKDAQKIIKSQDISISKVLKLSKLKTDYKAFEAKRKLCDSYDLFLVDKRIVHFLPKLLGKHFFKKRKSPLSVDLTKEELCWVLVQTVKMK